MQESPNSLQPQPPKNPMSRRPMYIGIGVVLLIVAALMYALDDSERKRREKPPEVTVDERALVAGQGAGVILPPPTPPPPAEVVEKKPVVVVVQGEGEDKDAEELRKRRRQMLLNALSSPMLKQQSGGATRAESRQAAAAVRMPREQDGAAAQPPGSENYDPAANIDKEGFFTRADTGDAGWLSRYTREEGRLLEIKTGTVIPAVLISGINSDLPGVLIAQVSQNVYNTANGRHLLIPQGAKLYGVYDSRVVYGQERTLVAWNRIIFPDGSSVTLGAMPGADMSGYSGFHDQVNNHYVRIFGTAFLMSAVIGTTAYAVDKLDKDSSDDATFQDELGTALANQMGSAAMAILQRNLGIAPTLEIRPGYQFNVVTTKDLAFAEPYTHHRTGR